MKDKITSISVAVNGTVYGLSENGNIYFLGVEVKTNKGKWIFISASPKANN